MIPLNLINVLKIVVKVVVIPIVMVSKPPKTLSIVKTRTVLVKVPAKAAIPIAMGFLIFVFNSTVTTTAVTMPTQILGKTETRGFWKGMLTRIGS